MSKSETKAPILLSVVMPLSDIDDSSIELIRAAAATVEPLVADYEIIVVENGAKQESAERIDQLTSREGLPNIQVYRLIRQVEFDMAAWAGAENSLGDYVLIYDAFNESLDILPTALRELEQARELVLIRNLTPTDRSLAERVLGDIFRTAFSLLSGIDFNNDAAPYRLMSKRIISFLLLQPRPSFQYRILPSVAGFSVATLTYNAPRRTSRRGLLARAARAVNILLTNTFAPLRIVSAVALSGAVLNVIYSTYVVAILLFKRNVAPGWGTLSLQQSCMFFLLSFVLFVIAEYMVHFVRWSLMGTPYFITGEKTSAMISRRQRLNVTESHRDQSSVSAVG